MSYNLLHERWMPVRRADGSEDRIAPHEVVPGPGESPPVAFAASRPDFDGALAQFMIGLLQTAMPPRNDDEVWANVWEERPTQQALRDAFEPYAEAFDLDGDGPRFLQDLDADLDGKAKPAAYLLVETPTDSTLSNNADHFVKDRTAYTLSMPSAAMALLSMQLNAPSGGRGHRTSLRGGGPLTTLVTADPVQNDDAPLWRTLWLNVLRASAFKPTAYTPEDIFPWMRPTRTSEKGSSTELTVPGEDGVHPLEAFWGMPRRIRLHFDGAGMCSLTGERAEQTVAEFVTVSYGTNYSGPWEHPLSPHRVTDDGPIPLHGQPGPIGYADWLALALGQANGQRTVHPAPAVKHMTQQRAPMLRADDEVEGLNAFGLWVFGFDTDNMKVRAWQSGEFPLYAGLSVEDRERLRVQAEARVQAASLVVWKLKDALKKALYGSPSLTSKRRVEWDYPFHIKNDSGLTSRSLFAGAESQLWADTEPAFFASINTAVSDLRDTAALRASKVDWLGTLKEAALDVFDRLATPAQQHQGNPMAVTLARRYLEWITTDNKLREMLGIKDPPAHD